jgi:mono/diheme cytochrome c family protein
MKRLVKWGAVIAGILLVVLVSFGFWVRVTTEGRITRKFDISPVVLTQKITDADVELGKRIVHVRNGCVECHGTDLAGKAVIEDVAIAQIHGPNITPAALRDWTDGEIARAIRHGVGRDGKPLLLMPSYEYNGLSESDLVAVIAYLRSVPAVEPKPRLAQLGPIGRVLLALGQMPTMVAAEVIDHSKGFGVKPPEGETVEFGRYLTQSCIGCHRANLTGGPIPGAPPDWLPAKNISGAAIGSWGEAGFIKAMREGVNPAGEKIRPPMPINISSQMSDTELKAIWAYLQTVR